MAGQDDELIIIEDNNDNIDLWKSNLIELDESKNEELISFEEPKEKIQTKTEETSINLEESSTESILDFNLEPEAENKLEEKTTEAKQENNIDLNLSLEENINLEKPSIEIKEETNEIKEETSDFGFDLEESTKQEEITEAILETETLNTILEWTILKLASRKETINKKIENTKTQITDIETEIKKLQEERKNLLAEVRELTSENKKIDENIESLEEMKIWKENKTIKIHNSNRKPVNNKNYKKEKIAA